MDEESENAVDVGSAHASLMEADKVAGIDYVSNPDFNSQAYYNWLTNFAELCKLVPVPLDVDLFQKISQVRKNRLLCALFKRNRGPFRTNELPVAPVSTIVLLCIPGLQKFVRRARCTEWHPVQQRKFPNFDEHLQGPEQHNHRASWLRVEESE